MRKSDNPANFSWFAKRFLRIVIPLLAAWGIFLWWILYVHR
jgi:hypothetical protein